MRSCGVLKRESTISDGFCFPPLPRKLLNQKYCNLSGVNEAKLNWVCVVMQILPTPKPPEPAGTTQARTAAELINKQKGKQIIISLTLFPAQRRKGVFQGDSFVICLIKQLHQNLERKLWRPPSAGDLFWKWYLRIASIWRNMFQRVSRLVCHNKHKRVSCLCNV